MTLDELLKNEEGTATLAKAMQDFIRSIDTPPGVKETVDAVMEIARDGHPDVAVAVMFMMFAFSEKGRTQETAYIYSLVASLDSSAILGGAAIRRMTEMN